MWSLSGLNVEGSSKNKDTVVLSKRVGMITNHLQNLWENQSEKLNNYQLKSLSEGYDLKIEESKIKAKLIEIDTKYYEITEDLNLENEDKNLLDGT